MLQWSEEYSTGIKDIDQQHKLLFKFVNVLEEEIKKGSGAEVIQKAVDFMEEYAREHFRFEEMCMCGVNCAETNNNKEAHGKFIEKLKEFDSKAKTQSNQQEVVIEMHRFVEDWLKTHLLNIDSKLKQCWPQKAKGV